MSNSTAPVISKPSDEPPPHPGMGAVTTGRVQAPRVFDRDERSQATQVEQARAIAEVQAAIYVAQERPRNIDTALDEMRRVCAIPAMAERAFFKFSRGGSPVTGATVHLARELARIWGNLTFGISELSRSDVRKESEMLAYAWDLQTNVRPSNTFIVPHARDTRTGVKPLVDMRDIYENNANMGARRLRECIFACLPKWFTDEAEDICRVTLEAGGGVSIKDRIDQMFNVANTLGVTEDMIVKRIGKGIVNITHSDLADIKITFRSIKNGEIRKEEAFPDTSAADVTAHLKAKSTPTPASATPEHKSDAVAEPPSVPRQDQDNAAALAPSEIPDGDASEPSPNRRFADEFIARINRAGSVKVVSELCTKYGERLNEIDATDHAIYAEIQAVITEKRERLAR